MPFLTPIELEAARQSLVKGLGRGPGTICLFRMLSHINSLVEKPHAPMVFTVVEDDPDYVEPDFYPPKVEDPPAGDPSAEAGPPASAEPEAPTPSPVPVVETPPAPVAQDADPLPPAISPDSLPNK